MTTLKSEFDRKCEVKINKRMKSIKYSSIYLYLYAYTFLLTYMDGWAEMTEKGMSWKIKAILSLYQKVK